MDKIFGAHYKPVGDWVCLYLRLDKNMSISLSQPVIIIYLFYWGIFKK